jgi:hypothetical protein
LPGAARQAELAELMAVLATAAAGRGVVGIHAIDGMAGIGKTTFAVHAAHRLTGAFPDGQFFLPLHAHTAGQRPVHPADALTSEAFVRRADLYKSCRAQKRSVISAVIRPH